MWFGLLGLGIGNVSSTQPDDCRYSRVGRLRSAAPDEPQCTTNRAWGAAIAVMERRNGLGVV